jgi:hypothetical protein
MILINPRADHLDLVMSHACAKAHGQHGYLAFIAECPHVASCYGEDAGDALTKLRAVVNARWLEVLCALKIVSGREPLARA